MGAIKESEVAGDGSCREYLRLKFQVVGGNLFPLLLWSGGKLLHEWEWEQVGGGLENTRESSGASDFSLVVNGRPTRQFVFVGGGWDTEMN